MVIAVALSILALVALYFLAAWFFFDDFPNDR